MLGVPTLSATLAFAVAAASLLGAEPAPEQLEFFEKQVRPVLVRSCFGCHSSAIATPMGGLRVDSREALLTGGKRGAAIVPGEPDSSLLLKVLTYSHTVKMPPSGKLPDEQIAAVAEWIRIGAPQPDPTTSQGARSKSVTEARKAWPFNSVQDPPVPSVKRAEWVQSPIDAFILSRLEAQGLEPAPPVDKATLIRRATFDLMGLPPAPNEIDAFIQDSSPDAWHRVVDRLLASPHYGERWARHWLDLMRYAETNGHEFDNDKLAPWRYRDYLIRAFNADLPYDQFVREHLAGDLLPAKRMLPDGSAVESPLGTIFYWFGEVLNSATDSVKSRADEVDNQIDVAGKAFQGLTVACARCHDHKFDPIPTSDYYALAGVFHSTSLQEDTVDSPERTGKLRELSRQILELNTEIDRATGITAPPRPAIQFRPGDTVAERFDVSFGRWRPAGIAFGDGPLYGTASSLAAGSEVFTGTLTSPKFRTEDKLYLHVRIAGTRSDRKLAERGLLRLTLVADGFKSEHIMPQGNDNPRWQTARLVLQRKRDCYFEIVDHSRSGYIAVDEIVFSDSAKPPSEETATDLAHSTYGVTKDPDWLESLWYRRRQLEAAVPESPFAMLASDDQPRDVRIHVRGSHTQLGDIAPRGFLRVVAEEHPSPIRTGSGRLQVAESIASPRNPLTARVMVNRIWKHHFIRGIVRSLDNFGAMGDPPTHPELLDFLASRFVESGWSVKTMHRLMLLSSAYRMSSQPSERAKSVDPENKLLQHMPVRRLEAEAIRDSLLAISGTLNPEMFGPSVVPYISSYQEGRGKPQSGPLDGNGRRSIYLQVRRNFLTPMFLAFDYPPPISSIGSRGVSTVPSQALLMMNNEFVAEQAGFWAQRAIKATASPRERIDWMYRTAFARPAEPAEVDEILTFTKARSAEETHVWTEIAHVLINSPEFIYLR